jgi:hypothetical protein
LPSFLRKDQNLETTEPASPDKTFSGNVHVDLIDTHAYPGKTIISITNDSQTFATSAVIPDNGLGSIISAVWNYWCEPFGLPETISFKQGKVQTSKMEKGINDLAPLKQKISCRSRKDTFNTEIEHQWRQNQHELSGEEFVQAWNFLNNPQKPATDRPWRNTFEVLNNAYENPTDDEDIAEDSDEHENDFENLLPLKDDQPTNLKRKDVSLCRHKLQRRPGYRSRTWRQLAERVTEFKEDDEWAQLREMEQFLAEQERELLRQGIPESDDEDWSGQHWPEEDEDDLVKEEDNILDNEDLTYITSILASFSKPKSHSGQPNELDCAIFAPEGAPMREAAKRMTPPKFNQKLTIKDSGAENFSCFSTFWEEGPTELADYSDEEEDDSLDNEDTLCERDTCNKSYFEDLEEITDEEDTWSETEVTEFEFKTHDNVSYEVKSEETIFKGISSISTEIAQAFSTWQPYIPPEPIFRNSSIQSWWSDFSQPAPLSQEPTLIQISAIKGQNTTTKQTPAPTKTIPSKRKMG